MKVIFLDIDGVICLSDIDGVDTNSSLLTTKSGIDVAFDSFNKKCIETLNEIITTTDCEIVISSDWRHHLTLEQLGQLFEVRGIMKKPIAVTDFVEPKSVWHLEKARAKEIEMFLGANGEINKWVVVDDMDLSPFVVDNFVQTPNIMFGISQEGKKEKIIEFLKI